MGCKFGGDFSAFCEKYALLSADKAAEYAIHGGAVPVRVEGVEGVVAVVVVSGLSQAEDHQVVMEGLEDCIAEMQIPEMPAPAVAADVKLPRPYKS